MHWMPKKLPTARAEGLLVERVGDEVVIFDVESTDSHCLGSLAAAVFDNCDGRTSLEGIAEAASHRLGRPVDVERVQDAIGQLADRKLLSVVGDGISRRDLMKRGAIVAFSAPLIATVSATPAVAGASATCGGFRDISVLCCPCATGADDGKKGCCETPFTNQCVCTKAESNNTKYCKPAGVGAEGDNFCQQSANFPCCNACQFVAVDCDQPLTPGGNCNAPGTGGCTAT